MVDIPIRDWHEVNVELAISEASLALLTAEQVHNRRDEDAALTIRNARRVYERILERRKDLRINLRQASTLNRQLERLRRRLLWLGEDV